MRLLFVCTGNTCRSPLAEAIARRIAESTGADVEVGSAGTGTVDGAPASDAARAVAREAGLDLDAHAARLLRRSMVQEADLVLVMNERQREFIRVLAPEALDRVHRLREYATRGERADDVDDPFGGDAARYRRTLNELRELVDKSLQRLSESIRPRRTR